MEEGAFSLFFVLFLSTSERETGGRRQYEISTGGADNFLNFFFNMNMIQM